jgi:DNA-binding Lrp family transcriptional regulator
LHSYNVDPPEIGEKNMSTTLSTDKIRLEEQYAGVAQKILRELDAMAIRIFSAMWRYGPRNLLEVSRRTNIPFTSVYHRIERIESRSGPIVELMPRLSKLGMIRIMVLATARLGCEDAVTRALTAPNLWSAIDSCEGNFTHDSVHSVPVRYVNEFADYLQHLSKTNLVSDLRIIRTGDYVPNFPDFSYYNPHRHEWSFPWADWLFEIIHAEPTSTLLDPVSYETDADKKDLLIVKELQTNARKSYSELASLLGITLYGVKYHFDKKLIPQGITTRFQFNVAPYAKEISAFHEIMLEFENAACMDKFVSTIPRLFFVIGFSKVLSQDAILLRTYLLESQLHRLFEFFSELARSNILRSYSAIRKNLQSRRTQTISYELYDERDGWKIDFQKLHGQLLELSKQFAHANA